jgi:hypothetical protein
MANQPNPLFGGVRRLSSERSLAIGWLLIGLLIGLLVGWVLWPVQWSDADPDDLRPEARAHFIAATADAYVASGGQDPNTALARMQSFADPQTAVADAIAFFQQSGDPRRAIREVNLRSLSSALGSTPATFADTRPPQTDRPEISWSNWLFGILTGLLLLFGGGWIIRRVLADRRSGPATPVAATPASQSSPSQASPIPPLPLNIPKVQPSPNDGGWLPSAPPDQTNPIGLGRSEPVGHAAQVGRSVQLETWDDPSDTPAFVEPAFSPSPSNSIKPRPFPSAVDDEEPLRRVLPSQSRAAPVDADAEAEEAAGINRFIDFSLAEAEEDDTEDDDENEWKNWEAENEQPGIRKVIPVALDDDDFEDDEDVEWQDEWDDETSDDETSDAETSDAKASDDDPLDADPLGGGVLDDDDLLDGEDEWDLKSAENPLSPPDSPSGSPPIPAPWIGGSRPALALPALPASDEDDDAESGFIPTVQGVLNSLGFGEKEGRTKGRDGKEIGSYTAEYNIGIMAYDQSFTITSGAENVTPLGACGMAISEEVDKSAANSNNVRVLQVWLYDGMEVRTSSQYLVSPGLDKEALGEQAKSAGTITGEPLDIAPGVTFRIPAKNLFLDCRIVSADFITSDAKPNPLRTVRVEMKVKAVK